MRIADLKTKRLGELVLDPNVGAEDQIRSVPVLCCELTLGADAINSSKNAGILLRDAKLFIGLSGNASN
ncbi:MAG: hypothetical protein ACXW3C_05695 [Pyrinomonadaceae bacterium]